MYHKRNSIIEEISHRRNSIFVLDLSKMTDTVRSQERVIFTIMRKVNLFGYKLDTSWSKYVVQVLKTL